MRIYNYDVLNVVSSFSLVNNYNVFSINVYDKLRNIGIAKGEWKAIWNICGKSWDS